ncbi:MAG: hypothetical protein HY320_00480 [Armatimonadetes bacterium]|nr:hypothetical protein [Armatimonadota bacterium]
MTRQEILDQITQAMGKVPEWLSRMSDAQLEHEWPRVAWLFSDTALSSHDKALVGFGAAAAAHCPY